MNNTARLAAIDALTAKIPTFECVPGCADCCGPVLMSRLEWKRIVGVMAAQGVSERQLRASADRELEAQTYGCSMLRKDNRCGCYAERPVICRLFGAVDTPRLVCPHGKAPAVNLSDAQASAMMAAVEGLGR